MFMVNWLELSSTIVPNTANTSRYENTLNMSKCTQWREIGNCLICDCHPCWQRNTDAIARQSFFISLVWLSEFESFSKISYHGLMWDFQHTSVLLPVQQRLSWFAATISSLCYWWNNGLCPVLEKPWDWWKLWKLIDSWACRRHL